MAVRKKPGMSKKEFEDAGYSMSLSEMADYCQEWFTENSDGDIRPKALDDACSAAWSYAKDAVTPAHRRTLVDWFRDHY